jgi:hypothetical protein
MTTAPIFSPKQTRISEIIGACSLVAMMILGLVAQALRLNVGGAALMLVAPVMINWINLLRSQIAQASARIDDLEKKLATFRPQSAAE